MDIKTNSLFAQMQSMSLQASGNRLPAVGGDLEGISNVNSSGKINTSSQNFGNLLTDALKTVHELQQDTGAKKNRF